jgi:hypothetical protein
MLESIMRKYPRLVNLKGGRFMVLSGTSQKFEKVVLPEDPKISRDEVFPFSPPVGNVGHIPLYNLAAAPDTPAEDVPRAIIDAEDFARLRKHHWTGVRKKLATKTIIRVYTKPPGNTCAQMGRVVMGVTDPNLRVRYINGNPLDNRKCNLAVEQLRKRQNVVQS